MIRRCRRFPPTELPLAELPLSELPLSELPLTELPLSELIEVELYRVVIQEKDDQQFLHLRVRGGERAFPIVIGFNEATEIHRKLTRREAVRPMTHDLIGRILYSLEVSLERVVITELRDATFYANLCLELGRRAEAGRLSPLRRHLPGRSAGSPAVRIQGSAGRGGAGLIASLCGGLAERLNALVLKTSLERSNGGSNPSPSATCFRGRGRRNGAHNRLGATRCRGSLSRRFVNPPAPWSAQPVLPLTVSAPRLGRGYVERDRDRVACSMHAVQCDIDLPVPSSVQDW